MFTFIKNNDIIEYMKDKVILVDCDGVLVDWLYTFDIWVKERYNLDVVDPITYRMNVRYNVVKGRMKEIIAHFNESSNIGYLPPLRDSIKYIKKLHEEHGYVFHCITSLSTNPYSAKLRTENLKNLFGPTAFEKVICLGCGDDKDSILKLYEGSECFWVEDKIENANVGKKFGLKSILMKHTYNSNVKDIPVANNWKEIYCMITGE